MFVEVYIHYHSLVDFNEGKAVNAKFNFMNQNDVRLLLDVNKIKIIRQTEGILVQKKTFFEKLQIHKNYLK